MLLFLNSLCKLKQSIHTAARLRSRVVLQLVPLWRAREIRTRVNKRDEKRVLRVRECAQCLHVSVVVHDPESRRQPRARRGLRRRGAACHEVHAAALVSVLQVAQRRHARLAKILGELQRSSSHLRNVAC